MNEPPDSAIRTPYMTINHALQRVRWCLRRCTTALVSHPVLTTLAALLLLAVTLAQVLPDRFFVLNLSPSVACRVYVLADAEPVIGNLVEFRTKELFGSGYLCPHGTILKPIAAGPGDHIDTTGESLFINAERVAPIFTRDSEGRPLPVWRVNRVLERDEFFVLSTRVWNSLDSRYLGSIRRNQIVAVRVPLSDWMQNRVADGERNRQQTSSE